MLVYWKDHFLESNFQKTNDFYLKRVAFAAHFKSMEITDFEMWIEKKLS